MYFLYSVLVKLDIQSVCVERLCCAELEILAGIMFIQATLASLVRKRISVERERDGGPSAPTSCWWKERPDRTAGAILFICGSCDHLIIISCTLCFIFLAHYSIWLRRREK